jgi:primosomal protein N' (replication factor Y)
MNYVLYVEGVENGFYTYSDRDRRYKAGDHVWINFRRSKKVGIVLYEDKSAGHEFKISEILGRVEEQVSYSVELIDLFLWIKNYYLCNFGDILGVSRPKNIKMSYSKRIIFNKSIIPMDENEREFIDYITKKQTAAKTTMVQKFGKKLLDKFIKSQVVLENNTIKENKYLKNEENSIKYRYNRKKSHLTVEQAEVKDKILEGSKKYYLLKGITGSGKTEVYIELVKDALEREGGAIFLVPEISLTPQMVDRFKREFDEIAILHSKLTAKERASEWKAIYSGEKRVVLGVRSAIFAPVKDLKYIIIDEEHEATYKQDSNPRYNAKYVAIKRAEIEGAKIVLGSATPSIESYYHAAQGVFQLLELKKRYGKAIEPSMKLVDMKGEKNDFFSEDLIGHMAARLRKDEQIMLLLNRKGYSTFVQCHSCGHIETCPHCSISLSYYKKDGLYKCNYCEYTKRYSNTCSNCGEKSLEFSGKGTERVESELNELFDLPILRVDSETTKTRDSHNRIYSDFLNKKYNIMVGTQMISKGFHFPEVTLVGIINSDSILNFPDFRAGEKTFQLVSQAAGRAGRAEKKGEVIVQTYQPDNYVIQKIIDNDYEGFYEEEIENRRILSYPPFSRIINIIISSKEEGGLEEYTGKFYKEIKKDTLEMYGPMAPPIYKMGGNYRCQIFIKGSRREINRLKGKIAETVLKFKSNDRKNKYRITVDVDPINLM